MDTHVIPTMTHGRVLVREARAAARRGLLVGFHGYMENARIHMERLEAIPGSSSLDARVDSGTSSLLSGPDRRGYRELDDARGSRRGHCGTISRT